MKIPHRTRGWDPDRTDRRWAEHVEEEAETHTARRQVAYEKAQRRLARAAEKVSREAAKPRPDVARLAKLRVTAEARRLELLALEKLMREAPAGAQHRGKGSHRGIPSGGTL